MVGLSHGFLTSHYMSFAKIPYVKSNAVLYVPWRGFRVLFARPLSIAAGLFHLLGINLAYEMKIVPPPPGPMTGKLLNMVHVHGEVQWSILFTTLLSEISKRPEYLEYIRRLRYLAYVDAPCPPQLAEHLASKTRLQTLYRSSETGTLATDLTEPEDGEYIRFNPTIAQELRPTCRNLYELIIVRHATSGSFQGIFFIYPHSKEYRMGDLFSKHPTKSNM